eukprot:Skav205382  [mRNA]  locus=scaffold277:137658:138674:+ [translate_table: standard]
MISILSIASLAAALREDSHDFGAVQPAECSCGVEYDGKCNEDWSDQSKARPCCPFFATQCDPSSPLGKKYFQSECTFDKPHQYGLFQDQWQMDQKCQEVECSNVHQAIATSLSMTQQHEHKEVQRSQKARPKMTGKSNNGRFRKCACGKFNPETSLCAVEGKSKERKCCTLLDDCPSTSDLFMQVKQDEKETKEFFGEKARLHRQLNVMRALYQECDQNCKLRYYEKCMEDLKEKVDGMSRQEAYLRKAHKEHLGQSDWKEQKIQRVERLFAKAKADPVQLIDLSTWDGRSAEAPCCKCAKVFETVKKVDFCLSSTCPENCEEMEASFCGKATGCSKE